MIKNNYTMLYNMKGYMFKKSPILFQPFGLEFYRSYAYINNNNTVFDEFVKTEGSKITFTINYKNFIFKQAFKDYFNQKLIDNQSYYVLIKIRYDNDYFKMLGKQFTLHFDRDDSLSKLEDLHNTIVSRLSAVLEEYNVDPESVVNLQLIFKPFSFSFFSDIKIPIDLDYKGLPVEIKKDVELFPITYDEQIIGEKLTRTITDNKEVFLKYSAKDDFISIKYENNNSIVLHDNTLFYFRDVIKPNYILAICQIHDNLYIKEAYTPSGVFIKRVQDDFSKNITTRTSNKSVITFDSENFFKTLEVRNIDFTPIQKTTNKKANFIENNKIGVIDLEVFKDTISDKERVYSAGIYSYLDTNKPIIFYIDKLSMNDNKVVLDMVNELLRDKYKGTTFYCHNFGRYDVIFILKILTDFNNTIGKDNPYILDFVFRGNTILKLTIKRQKNSGSNYYSTTICDSYPILSSSLAKLCRDFNVETPKGVFPHTFANESTLFYKGSMPSFSYYSFNGNNDITHNNFMEEYYKSVWDFKEQSNIYLTKDLMSLYQVITKANHALFIKFDVNITDAITISGLALTIFRQSHYDNEVIPLINNKKYYDDIKNAYYGGCTEVYRPYGEDLYYYDVNSLYPFVALNDMPGTKCNYIQFYKDQDINDLFGFFYCKIECDKYNDYIGLLPVRSKNKGLLFPLGRWEGWYFSEELQFAQQNGYKIKVIKGYNFNREKDIFKSYIDSLYKIKSSTNNKTPLKSIVKLLLNSLLGRFGLRMINKITELVNKEKYEHITSTRQLYSEIELNEDNILLSYDNNIDMDLCKSLGLDITKVIEKYDNFESKSYKKYDDISVAISAAITSYARIHMSKVKLDILKKGGLIYYTDTDSIVTNIPLDGSFVSPTEIGKFKQEYKVDKGYFISNKTYCLLVNNEIIKKSKGVNSKNLTLNNYINMYLYGSIIKTNRMDSIKNYKEGFVTIYNNTIEINPSTFLKRHKIYDRNQWIDTTPHIIGYNDKDLNLVPISKSNIISSKFKKINSSTPLLSKIQGLGFMDKFLFNLNYKILPIMYNIPLTLFYLYILWLFINIPLYDFLESLKNFSNTVWFDIELELDFEKVENKTEIKPIIDIELPIVSMSPRWYTNLDIETIESTIDIINTNQLKEPLGVDINIDHIRRFIRTYFAMLDFNNLKYYPSLFQGYNWPSIVEWNVDIQYSKVLFYIMDDNIDTNSSLVSGSTSSTGLIDHSIPNVSLQFIQAIMQIPNTAFHPTLGGSETSIATENTISDSNIETFMSNRGSGSTEGFPISQLIEIHNRNLEIVKELELEINELLEDRNEGVIELMEQNTKIKSLNNQIINYKSFIVNSSQKYENINFNINRNANEIVDMNIEINTNNNNIPNYNNEIQDLQDKLVLIEQEKSTLELKLDYTNNLLDSKYDEHDKFTVEQTELQNKIVKLNENIFELQDLLQDNNYLLLKTEDKNRMLTDKLEIATDKIKSLRYKLQQEKQKVTEYLDWYEDTYLQLLESQEIIKKLSEK